MKEIFPYAGQQIELTRRRMKNMYLRVAPDGKITMSAPTRTPRADLIAFLAKNWNWVLGKLAEAQARPARPHREYVTGERVPLWGRYYELVVRDSTDGRGTIYLKDDRILMYMPQGATYEQRLRLVNDWYRYLLERAVPSILAQQERIVGKHASEWRIRNMRTRWGTCNVVTGRIWLNLQLAKYDPEALRYIITHELTHLWERNHGAAFQARMDKYYPHWREVRAKLNKEADFD